MLSFGSRQFGSALLRFIKQPANHIRYRNLKNPSNPVQDCFLKRNPLECLDYKNIVVERGMSCHAQAIKAFLCMHYWPREPTVTSLWMDVKCKYLKQLSDKFSNTGDRFVAMEIIPRTKEKRVIGFAVAYKVFPWMIQEMLDWARYTQSKPERNRMLFMAHMLQEPNLFEKYNTPFLYDIECLGTTPDVSGFGIGKMLLRYAMFECNEVGFPLMQMIAVSSYAAKICESCGMEKEWSMNYSDFHDHIGQKVFYPRSPHHTVNIYIKKYPK